MKSYQLMITNIDDNRTHVLKMEGLKTFTDLKQDAISLTGISFKHQEWGGFPGKNTPDESV